MNLIEIKSEIPDVILDIRYATTNNLTGKILYEKPFALLAREPLAALRNAADKFRKDGRVIVVFDAWRSPNAQKMLLKFCNDKNYVSETPRHSNGNIIDMTLADKDGSYLDMGTDYDNFTERSHSDYQLLNQSQKANRVYLNQVMKDCGFKVYPYEWWDFEYVGL